MNPLAEYPEVRKYLYLAQWVINLAMGVLGIVLSMNGDGITDLPEWYLVTSLVLAFVWSYTGITAQTNVGATPTQVVVPPNVPPNPPPPPAPGV